MDNASLTCPNCKTPIVPGSKFCSNCGIALTSLTTVSIGKQIWIYFVSFFLPPLGLIWTFKYFRSPNSQQKKVAIAAAILTIVGAIITLWVSLGVFNTINQQVQQQLNGYQNLGL